MDLSFFRRAERRFASRQPAALDFGMLSSVLQAQQAVSAAAAAERLGTAMPRIADPLPELILAGPDWRAAAAAQRGAFHPALARQRGVN